MIVQALRTGERLGLGQAAGFALCVAGLIALLMPGLTAPPPGSSLMMIAAGVAWGVYSLRGRASADPLETTAGNFIRAALPAALLGAVLFPWARFDAAGLLLAVISGAVTSGIGYVVWYTALRDLTSSSAAVVQLSVPVLTALGGIVFLGESLTLRLLLSSLAVLGGIALVIGRAEGARGRTS
jgi:drug/metabolite transporter (DMT)-like permease